MDFSLKLPIVKHSFKHSQRKLNIAKHKTAKFLEVCFFKSYPLYGKQHMWHVGMATNLVLDRSDNTFCPPVDGRWLVSDHASPGLGW